MMCFAVGLVAVRVRALLGACFTWRSVPGPSLGQKMSDASTSKEVKESHDADERGSSKAGNESEATSHTLSHRLIQNNKQRH